MIDHAVTAHYELGFEEDRLFSNGKPRLELVRTLELLERLLPEPPGRIIDIGGGTGVYALPLCRAGYTVDLVEPVTLHVERASSLAEAERLPLQARLGDARDLGEVLVPYDAALLLGPLYHLTRRDERVKALQEAVRVVRPGGVVIAVGISRFASLLDGLKRRALDDPTFRGVVELDLLDGQHRNPDVDGRPDLFTTAYFHRPEELEQEAMEAGVADAVLYAVEGPGWILEDPEDLDAHVYAAGAVESDRGLIAASAHIMVAGRTSNS